MPVDLFPVRKALRTIYHACGARSQVGGKYQPSVEYNSSCLKIFTCCFKFFGNNNTQNS